jgi:alkylated DNA repair dioxygenase AlkB
MSFQRIPLTLDSHIILGEIPEHVRENFMSMWNSKPTLKSSINIFGKMIQSPRYVENYLQPYTYSGVTLPAKELPVEFCKLFKWANMDVASVLAPGRQYNQCLVNFYENGHHYIGRHSDNEKDFMKYAPIFSASFGQERTFRIRDKKTKKIVQDIQVKDGTFIIMCGKMQKEFYHEIPKVGGDKGAAMGKRINVTFRVKDV